MDDISHTLDAGNATTRCMAEEFLGATLPPDFEDGAHARFLDKPDLEKLMLERSPFFFIEKAVVVDDRTVWGVAHMDEARSAGHFPGRPIVPLIELCKAMAQTGIILAALQGDESKAPVAISSGPSKATAKDFIEAPVTIITKVTLEKTKLRMHHVNGATYTDGQLIGTLSDIVYILVERAVLLQKKK